MTQQSPLRLVQVANVIKDMGDYDVNWMIDDWVPEDALIGIYAPPGSFKTWVLLEAAVAVALGENSVPFLNKFNVLGDAKPVLVFQQEDYIGQIGQRLRTLLMAKSDNIVYEYSVDGTSVTVDSPLFAPIYVHPDSKLRFDDKFSMDALEDMIKDLGAKLVVIDPLYMLEPADDKYFAGAAQGGMARLKEMRTRYGVTFILAHHTRKGAGKGREAMWGSQLLNGAFEGVWQITKEGNVLNITKEGKFFKTSSEYDLMFEIDTTPENEKYEVIISDVEETQLTGKYDREVLDLLESNAPMTQSAIAKELEVHNQSIARTLERLVKNEFIIKDGRKYTVPVDIQF